MFSFMTRKTRWPLVLAAAASATMVFAACGGDESPTATPTRVPAPAAAATTAPKAAGSLKAATAPSSADLGGGSTQTFQKVFETALETSKHDPSSAYAAAAKSLPAGQKLKVGFIFVGSQKDLGYNQAAYEGSLGLQKAMPNIEILYAENIPETAQVQAVMEQMIQQGAKIIFATSYGYSASAKEMAKKHPDVIFLHQGDLESLRNYGAYFGNIWQLEYAAGVTAGKTTKSNKLGFIAAFPIPQTLLNVNAFTLGAKSVNPNITTNFVLLGSWCDPAKQAAAAKAMIDSGVDVLTQHQDCTGTIIQAAERAGVYVTGYHQDASSAAPNGWLTGAVWNWAPIYTELVSEIMKGDYRANVLFAGLDAGWVKLAAFGKAVSPDLKKQTEDTVEALRSGKLVPFTGPIKDQTGKVQIAAGVTPPDAQLQTVEWLVEGVTGSTKL